MTTPPYSIDVPAALLADLRRRHAEPARAYHDWSHVEALLALYPVVRARLADPVAVLWAILFHDAVYDPTGPDNEERSARLLEAAAAGAIDPASLTRAAAMVRATARHAIAEGADADERRDTAIFLDLDLSILAAPDDAFDRYEAQIRREYGHVADADFRAARARILRTFAERPRIYLSDWGHERFDAAARANLARSLDRLDAA